MPWPWPQQNVARLIPFQVCRAAHLDGRRPGFLLYHPEAEREAGSALADAWSAARINV